MTYFAAAVIIVASVLNALPCAIQRFLELCSQRPLMERRVAAECAWYASQTAANVKEINCDNCGFRNEVK